MLYDRWRQVAKHFRDEIALRDLSRGRTWTFADLARAAEENSTPAEPIVWPQGITSDFVFEVLRGWRHGVTVCPLETGQKTLRPKRLPQTCVHLKTTSGSTGTARYIAFAAEQLAADAENIVATMGLRHEWPNLGVISLAHSYGFSNLVLPLLLHGIPLTLAPSPLPGMVRQAALVEKEITLAAVPALWRAWHEAGAIPKNARLAVSAGAPLSLDLEQAVHSSIGLKIHNFYGASECGGIAYDRTETPRTENQFVGTAMENVSLSRGEDGCLEVRSGAVAQTYWPDPEPRLGGGCFQTTDLVEMDHDRIFLRGRASDLINVAGRKVSPESIEQILRTHPNVRECLVFGVPSKDADRTETIVAVIANTTAVPPEDLKSFLLQKLPAWQVPREWWLVKELSANGRGKISRAEWRKAFLDGGAK